MIDEPARPVIRHRSGDHLFVGRRRIDSKRFRGFEQDFVGFALEWSGREFGTMIVISERQKVYELRIV